jgi:hypothetical protein
LLTAAIARVASQLHPNTSSGRKLLTICKQGTDSKAQNAQSRAEFQYRVRLVLLLGQEQHSSSLREQQCRGTY